MCGRTACTLNRKQILKACMYTDAKGKKAAPEWVDVNSGGAYQPSYNMAPRRSTPVLVSEKQVVNEASDSQRIVCAMNWGLVPSWHAKDRKEFNLSTINCRLEDCINKPCYRSAFAKNRRCVILADGYFEWKALDSGGKQPYFIYFQQPESIDMKTRNWESDSKYESEETEDCPGPRLLTMAGVFDIWKDKDGKDYFSYAVITKDSESNLSWLHSRMPVILDDESAIQMWLDLDIDSKKALPCLPSNVGKSLAWHPVSSVVGNVQVNKLECVLAASPKKQGKQMSLTAWIKPKTKEKVENSEDKAPISSPKRSKSDSSEETPDLPKKIVKKYC